MSPVKGHYSIVQYCPDLARRETVNIGVVLLVPERAFLQTRMVADNQRVRHFFGITGNDAKLLSDFKKSFSARIEAEHGRVTTLETFQKFIDTRGNQIQLTEPAFVKVRECQETIDRLFDSTYANKGYALTIDLENQSIILPSNEKISFQMDTFRKHCLMNGLDDIGLTMQHSESIKAFEMTYYQKNSWLL
jgi:hypothetical protein